MPVRLRKLIATVALLILIAAYSLTGMVVAERVLPKAGPLLQLAFYAVAGLAWVPFAAVIIWWMYREGE